MTKLYIVVLVIVCLQGGVWGNRAAAQKPEPECVAVVGDSVAYGTLVFEVPGFGFFVARTQPISAALQDTLDAAGYDLEVRDYSVPASYLSPEGSLVYATTDEYMALLEDGCQYVVINAFINDLTLRKVEDGDGEDAELKAMENAAENVDVLADFIGALAFARPDVQIALVAYYHGQPATFVPEYAGDIINLHVPVFNEAIFEACVEGGRFQKLAEVTCLDVDAVFAEMDNTHVVTDVGQSLFYAILVEPVIGQAGDAFRIYWEQNPTAVVHGDGMHLSEAGKAALVGVVVEGFFGEESDASAK